MAGATYEIVERDEAGLETGRYVGGVGGGRVDVVVSHLGDGGLVLEVLGMDANGMWYLQRPRETKSHAQKVLDVFLPAGYPQSVSEDYIQYVWQVDGAHLLAWWLIARVK
jgi:hypothetical protein